MVNRNPEAVKIRNADGQIDNFNPFPVRVGDDSGNFADIIPTNGNNGIVAIAPGHVSTDNSVENADKLLADAVFTGEWEEITNFGVIVISVTSDVASATDGLLVQFSTDGSIDGLVSDDVFTIAAGAKKTFSFQAAAKFFRVVYTNGGSDQGHFHLQTVLKPYYVKPSSHRIKDNVSGEDDSELVKSILASDSGDGQTIKNINTQHPLATDGDQVFEKDIDQDKSTSDGWDGGEVIDLVNDNYTTLVNSTATNPKIVYMEFKRPLQTSVFGITTPTGDFSNAKITGYIGLGADQISFDLLDESTNDTKKTVLIPDIVPATVVAMKIEFFTSDTCSISANIISKALQRIVRMQALKPDGTVTDIDATAGGNLKVSIEEYDDAANPVRKNIEGGGIVAVGTSAVEVTFTGTTTHIMITAHPNNTGNLFIGKSDVTNLGANAVAMLGAGDIYEDAYDDLDNALYVVSDTASQNFIKGANL